MTIREFIYGTDKKFVDFKFEDDLVLKKLDKPRWFLLVKRFRVKAFDQNGQKYNIRCHEGLATDLSTVPYHHGKKFVRFLLILPFYLLVSLTFPAIGKHLKIAVAHDYLYETQIWSKQDTERFFLDGILYLGVPWWRAYPGYWFVRILGYVLWSDILVKIDHEIEEFITWIKEKVKTQKTRIIR